ncbi:D-aminoacyl-tRNA deacylase [Cognatishimia sp. 1_MG-2023]|uniref:D-aminoacyl-tRNA deacylase n=1 Tax=Cognatishimia sp. 1_MG-2023 TaxID=3062642 RepID=UPI0026E2ECA5|nr:D-aminoacyl-tRNA deacylase [Cognatishimia sp. 1_MG-2023]MDO6726663.1 D-aminoacyl-tRNA deacylase [Cognatishimia sp. 1_MG-2023]
MRALVQRVSEAAVRVDGTVTGEIEQGLLILICAMKGDTEADADRLSSKISKMRIFTDENGKMNKSVLDIGGSALVVSQFTLAADTRSGNRPGFSTACGADEGNAFYEYFAKSMADTGVPVAKGIFGADMKVSLINDGPVTIWIDTDQWK